MQFSLGEFPFENYTSQWCVAPRGHFGGYREFFTDFVYCQTINREIFGTKSEVRFDVQLVIDLATGSTHSGRLVKLYGVV